MSKHDKTIKEIYIAQAFKVASRIIKEALEQPKVKEEESKTDESKKDVVIANLITSIHNFKINGGQTVEIYFGNYIGKPFIYNSPADDISIQEENPKEEATTPAVQAQAIPQVQSSVSSLISKTFPGGRKKRHTRKKQTGGENPLILFAEILDEFLLPMLFKIPLFVTEIVIPIASAQMRKVILKYSAERTSNIIQFILNSVEINISRITSGENTWKTFDKNMHAFIKTIHTHQTKTGGASDTSENDKPFPELVANFLTQLNTDDLPLPEQLFLIAKKFPNIFEVINLIPKSVDDFFTKDMFDRIMQEAICEEMYQIMATEGSTFLSQVTENIDEFPKRLTIAEELECADFIKTTKYPAQSPVTTTQ